MDLRVITSKILESENNQTDKISSRILTRWLWKIAPDKLFSRKRYKRLSSFGILIFFLATACDTALDFYFCQVFVFNHFPEGGFLVRSRQAEGFDVWRKQAQDSNQYENPLNSDNTGRQGRFVLWVHSQAWSSHRTHLSSNIECPILVWQDFFIDIGFYFKVIILTWDHIVFFAWSLCSLFSDLIFEPNKQRQYPEK